MTRAQLLAIAIREAQLALRDEELLSVTSRPAVPESHHATPGSSSSEEMRATPPLILTSGEASMPSEHVLDGSTVSRGGQNTLAREHLPWTE